MSTLSETITPYVKAAMCRFTRPRAEEADVEIIGMRIGIVCRVNGKPQVYEEQSTDYAKVRRRLIQEIER